MNVCGKDINVQGRVIRIAQVDGDGFEFLEDPETVIASLRKSGVRIDLFTFTQKVLEPLPKYTYPTEWHSVAALPVSTFENWWTGQIDGKTRNMVRRAEKKDVVVREVPFDDTLVRGIWEIYNESPVRQGRPFPHYGKDIEAVRRMSATFPATSIFIGAFLGDTIVGFAKLTCDETGTQAGIMHILSMAGHRDKAPTNALIAQAVRSCAERGISHLVYSNFAYGKKQHDSLSDFKENNGFLRIDLPRYYVPLSYFGRIALRLGLHHSLVDQLPEPVVARVRSLRNTWYNRQLRPSAESPSITPVPR